MLGQLPFRIGLAVAGVGVVWFVLSREAVTRRIPWRVVRKDAVATKRISEQELGRRSLELAARLEERLGEYQRNDPRVLNWATRVMNEPDTDEWDRQQREENEHRAKFEGWFRERAQGEAAFVLTELLDQGLISREDLGRHWDFPRRPADVRDIEQMAALFATAGRRLRGDEPLERR